MLAYRHAFHAGNHADVLKHFVLSQILDHMNRKPKPYWAIDTHAGAGAYALDAGYAVQKSEYRDGIARLWERKDVPAPLGDYLDVVREFNGEGPLRAYPGSPEFIRRYLRDSDRLRMFELHPSDFPLLERQFAGDRRAKAACGDGFAALKALLPPPPRRGLVLMDPPYEIKSDYGVVVTAIEAGLARFADGVYAVWYPLLTRREPQRLVEQLKRLPVKGWLNAALLLREPDADGFGMLGSGMFILNPPWTLHDTLRATLPWMAGVLGQYSGARHLLEHKAA